MDSFLLFSKEDWKKARKNPPKNLPQNSPRNLVGKIPLGFLQKPFLDPLTRKVMSHSRDGPGVTAPLEFPPLPLPPLRSPRTIRGSLVGTFFSGSDFSKFGA